MTTSRVPFLSQFAQPIPNPQPLRLRYDPARQIAQILQNGAWVDTPDATEDVVGVSRKTAVAQETTDDE